MRLHSKSSGEKLIISFLSLFLTCNWKRWSRIMVANISEKLVSCMGQVNFAGWGCTFPV